MNILILGYSSLVRRKVINVLIEKGVKFSIASKSFKKKETFRVLGIEVITLD